MVLSDLWWNRIISSVQHFNLLKEYLSDEMNILLFCKSKFPWKNTLYKKLKTELGDITATRSIHLIRNKSSIAPGKLILESLCSLETQANFWPGQSYAEFFADAEDIALNSMFVWVEDISTKNDASKWIEFVNTYNKLSKAHNKNSKRAVFILECSGNFSFELKSECLATIDITPNDFDRHMFCIMNTSEINCSYLLKQYISELAFNFGGNNIELCGELVLKGLDLLENPSFIYKQVCENSFSVEDIKTKSDMEIKSDIIISQVKIIFPVLEQKRQLLIKKYNNEIKQALPIRNLIDEIVNEPYELELGALLLIVNKNKVVMSPTDKDLLRLCRDIRNKIAHNEILLISEIKSILE